MALFGKSRPPARQPTRPITAAATQIGVDSGEKAATLASKRREEWQTRAWEFYDEIGEVRQVARSMGDAFARVPWYVGVRPDPLGEVIPLNPDSTSEEQAELGEYRYTSDEARTAIAVLEALQSPIGGQSEIRRQIGVNLFVPGECYLVGVPVEDEENPRWDIRSTEELEIDEQSRKTNSAGEMVPTYRLKAPGRTGLGKELPADTFVVRIWRPHPRYQQWADSPMRSAMTICRELLTLTQAIQGAASSRIVGPGITLWPNSMRNQRGPDGTTRTDTTVEDIVEAASLAIKDPSSAAAQVPLSIWMDDQLWEKAIGGQMLIQWDREVDKIAAEQRSELITRFANAIDWPAELLTGKVGINHWGAWLLKDEAFQSNVEPYEVIAVDAITSTYLRPNLIEAGVQDAERFVVWFDPTGIVSDPDESDKALKASDHLLISWARERRALGFTEDDAPSDEELQQRIAIQAFLRNPNAAQPVLDGQAPPVPAPVEIPSTVRAETFANDPALEHLPKQLADMDQTLFTQVHQRADAAMRRALEKANNRLLTLAQKDRTLRPLIQGHHSGDLGVAGALGAAIVDRLTAADTDTREDLFAGAFLAFLLWYDVRLTNTDDALLAMAGEYGEVPPTISGELETARAASSTLLAASLATLAGALLLAPEPLTGPGEIDGVSLVPPGTVRDALKVAGGGGEQAASKMTGNLTRDLFGRVGVHFSGWVWVYGDPSQRRRPYPPHRALDGQTFGELDDDRLGNTADDHGYSFPGVSHFWPGDHAGCLCRVDLVGPTRAGTGLASFNAGGTP